MANNASLKRQVIFPRRSSFWLMSAATVLIAFGAGLGASFGWDLYAAEPSVADERDPPVADECNQLDAPCCASAAIPPDSELCKRTLIHSTVLASVMAEVTPLGTEALAPGARFAPEYALGEMIGFRIYNLRPESPLALLGMQNGDTIFGVDGVPLNNLDEIAILYQRLLAPESGEMRLELQRDQCALTVFVNLL